MISFPGKTRVLSAVRLIFLVALALGASSGIAHAATAATVPTVTDITQIQNGQNGWTITTTDNTGNALAMGSLGYTGVTSYVNSNGTEATCGTNASAGDTLLECDVTYPNGTTTDLQQDNNLSATNATQNTNVSANGAVTSQTSTTGTPTTLQNAANTTAACVGSGLWQCLIYGIAYFFFQLAATILGLIGLLFNWIVTVTVFEFGLYFANSAGMLLAWGILRDIGNIVILFGFILMGIMMILDLESFNVRKALPRLLIFAVLLNFSLFVSEAVVDVSNTLSAAFYQAAGNGIEPNGVNCTGQSALTNTSCTSIGISGTIITATGLTTIWNMGTGGQKLPPPNSSDGALVMVLLAFFVIIAAVVLLAGAIMLFVRAITLAFLLVISPLGFAGMAIPPFQAQANAWWKKLISEAFFAPVFLLLIFVSIKLAGIIQPSGSKAFSDAISASNSNNMGVIFLFLLIFGFMIASLVLSKRMGATGADFAINTSTRLMGGAMLGAPAFVGRRTVGRAANVGADRLRNTKFARTGIGKFTVGALDRTAKSSFDPRATNTVKNAAKAGGVDIGKAGGAGGYQKVVHDAEEDRKKYAKTLKNTKTEAAQAAALKSDIEAKERENKANLTQMDTNHRRARAGALRDVEAKTAAQAAAKAKAEAADAAVVEAQTSEDTEALRVATERAAVEHQSLEAAKSELTAARIDQQELPHLQAQQRSDLVEANKAQVDELKKEQLTATQAAQRGYANNLGKSIIPGFVQEFTAGPAADHHAKAAILKDLDKNDNQRLVDALTGVEKGLANQNHGGSGDGHAPAARAAAPAAAHAPAGGGGGGHH